MHIKVFHGTEANFEAFDPTYLKGESSLGIYFSTNPKIAQKYGEKVKERYITPTNPLEMDAVEYAEKMESIIRESCWDEEIGDYYYNPTQIKEEIQKLRKELLQKGYDSIHIIGSEEAARKTDSFDLSDDIWIMFHPQQIMGKKIRRARFAKHKYIGKM